MDKKMDASLYSRLKTLSDGNKLRQVIADDKESWDIAKALYNRPAVRGCLSIVVAHVMDAGSSFEDIAQGLECAFVAAIHEYRHNNELRRLIDGS